MYILIRLMVKKYYGITSSKKAEIRWGKNGYRYKSSPYFYNAIQKYGWDNFEHDVLFTDLTEDEAKDKEKYLIATYKTNEREFGYNTTSGGDGTVGVPFTREKHEKRGTCKSVVQIDMNGNKVNKFFNIHEASRVVGCSFGHISGCCNRYYNRKRVAGYYWMFSDEYEKWDKTLDSYFERFNKKPDKKTNKKREKSDILPNTSKTIYWYSLDGKLMGIYKSSVEAEKHSKVTRKSIINSCENNVIVNEKEIFSYTKDISIQEYSFDKRHSKVDMYSLDGEYLDTFDSIKEASAKIGVASSGISSCCRGKCKTSCGYIWKYAS